MLNKSDKLYAKYFEWKSDFDVVQDDNFGFCDLCIMKLSNEKLIKMSNNGGSIKEDAKIM